MYRYNLNSKEKFECPECGHSNRFVRYFDNKEGKYLDSKYGKCDRIDSCGYWLKPEKNQLINESESKVKTVIKNPLLSDNLNATDYLNEFHYCVNKDDYFFNRANNNFFQGLINRFGLDALVSVYDRYKLGHLHNNGVIFPYFLNGNLKSGKVIYFNADLHRDKSKNIQWLHTLKKYRYYDNYCGYMKEFYNPLFPDTERDDLIESGYDLEDIPDKFNFCSGLFGWDLLGLTENKNKTICLVESEKTAVICSIVFPEFIWLATGGKQNLIKSKFNFYSGRKWLIFPDLGFDESEQKSVSDSWKQKLNTINESYSMYYYFIDFVPEPDNSNKNTFTLSNFQNKLFEKKGADIADYVLDYKFKSECLTYTDWMKNKLKKYV